MWHPVRTDRGQGCSHLLAQVELLDNGLVPVRGSPLQIIQKTPSSSYQFKQTATRRMIFPVTFQMVSQKINPVRQQRDLNVGATGVLIVQLKRAQIYCFTRCHNARDREHKGEDFNCKVFLGSTR